MLVNKNFKFDLNDIAIVPAQESEINSRNDCYVYSKIVSNLETLPIMAAPMDTVVSAKNYKIYIDNGIIPCIPRNQKISSIHLRNKFFQSFGICDIERGFKTYEKNIWLTNYEDTYEFYSYPNVLIDTANGHMSKIVELTKKIKTTFPKINLMVGNVANPETFKNLANAGADYVRCSIGNGAGCTTASNVSINYPLASLVVECAEIKKQFEFKTKIVADGGMKNYSDVIKVLALGSDYVMIGNLFNKAIESAGFNYIYNIRINQKIAEILWRYNFPVKKKYRGMSTKEVQRSWGKSKLVTAEGITKYQKVEYSLSQWTENFTDYLKSAMSYTNSLNLEEFIGGVDYCLITENAFKRFNK